MPSQFNFSQVSPSSTWTITHNLNVDRVAVDAFIAVGSPVEYETTIPNSIDITDLNTITVNWSSPQEGRARIIARTDGVPIV